MPGEKSVESMEKGGSRGSFAALGAKMKEMWLEGRVWCSVEKLVGDLIWKIC